MSANYTKTIRLQVNGRDVEGAVQPRQLLVDFLRRNLQLTGTHVGCDTSQCGACTVLLNGGSIKSCTLLAVQADGQEVTTIEGLSQGEALHPIQRAFIEHHALQCGYCTPGMIMRIVSLLEEVPDPDEQTIRHELEGNICRCTGYQNIVLAVQAVAKEVAGSAAQEGAPPAAVAPSPAE